MRWLGPPWSARRVRWELRRAVRPWSAESGPVPVRYHWVQRRPVPCPREPVPRLEQRALRQGRSVREPLRRGVGEAEEVAAARRLEQLRVC